MPRIETEIDVKCRPEEAFDYLTDLRNATEWSTEVVDVSYDGKLARGTTGKDVRTMGRKQIVMPWTVTDFERPRRLVLEYGPPFPATADFSFAATKTGTVVNCDTDLRLRGWRRLLGPIITKEDRKADEIQFDKAKGILEARYAKRVGEEWSAA